MYIDDSNDYLFLHPELLDVYNKELRDELRNILTFWHDKMLDTVRGEGFFGEMTKDGTITPDAPKGGILNGRILWSFSAGARTNYNPEQTAMYTETAKIAFDYIRKYFYDSTNGGFYWSVDADGKPLDTKKQAYAQGFMIYGLSEYYRLTADTEALRLAEETYHLMETHFRDHDNGGYTEALAADWSPLEDMRLSDKDLNAPKSMNTHLHILEPYANLYRAHPTDELKESIFHCIDIFRNKIINAETHHFDLFFDMQWNRVGPKIESYGHDVEGAWLIYEAAELVADEAYLTELTKTLQLLYNAGRNVSNIIFQTLDDGSQVYTNALYYERIEKELDRDKHWWPQAEAMVACADAWRLQYGNMPNYNLQLSMGYWKFIKENLIDKETGEWRWRVNNDNADVYDDPRCGFWKCPYHNSRAMMEVIHRLEKYKYQL